MNQKINNIGNGANKLMANLVVEKKKALLAVCLAVVMVFMWVRAITGNKPNAAKAKSTAQQNDQNNQADSQMNITFIQPPNVPGRNDIITRDFFAADSWQNFTEDRQNSSGPIEMGIVSTDGIDGVTAQIAQKIKLQAIVMSEIPLAFINDKLVSVGDRFSVKDGTDIYEFEVVTINDNTVITKCGQAQITLKLLREVDVVD